MFGMEHGLFMHGLIVAGTWLLFVLACLSPLILLYGAYRLGVVHGRQEVLAAARVAKTGAGT